jgi:hypothetical protein
VPGYTAEQMIAAVLGKDYVHSPKDKKNRDIWNPQERLANYLRQLG